MLSIIVDTTKPVNDLAVSSVTPHVLASGSEDYTVRIWCLDPKYEKQPCAVICAGGLGEGHKEAVLTIVCRREMLFYPANAQIQAWHRTGRYLLSGGMDTVINMVPLITAWLFISES